jgi:hypothetical protein
MSVIGTFETFRDGRGRAVISPKPDIAWHPSMLVYEFTTTHRRFTRRFELCNSSGGGIGSQDPSQMRLTKNDDTT